MAQVLKAVGDAVGGAVQQIQEVTGIGKDDKAPKDQQDVQQEVDQAPAGADEEAGPEFTTTSKETEPSGEEVLKTTQDDVPLPQEPSTQADTTPAAPAEASKPATKPEPSPAAPASTPADKDTPSSSAEPVASGPMNQLRNMGGGSKPAPRTSKKWKQDSTSWYPDAGGVLNPPGFCVHKRRYPVA